MVRTRLWGTVVVRETARALGRRRHFLGIRCDLEGRHRVGGARPCSMMRPCLGANGEVSTVFLLIGTQDKGILHGLHGPISQSGFGMVSRHSVSQRYAEVLKVFCIIITRF